MAHDPDYDRIRQKAHELWVADGHPHGRDQDHWDQAREIIAIEDSQGDTLLPRDTGAREPIEDGNAALRNLADFPNLTDQGENLLTSTDREPTFAATPAAKRGRMPSVEVPTSDQPGMPSKAETAAAEPVPGMATAPKSIPPKVVAKPGPAPSTGARPKTASVAKAAQPEATRSSPAQAKSGAAPGKKK